MKLVLTAALVALLLGIGWGFYAGSQPAAARPHDTTKPVGADWYAALPNDPQAATAAYLARIPPEVIARGEAVANLRYPVWAAQTAVAIGSVLLLLFSGGAAKLAEASQRLSRRWRWVADLGFSAAMQAVLYAIMLPVDVFASYVRPRHFGFADQPFLGWWRDSLVNFAVSTIFISIGLTLFMAFIRARPKSWPILAGLAYLALNTAYTFATPTLIEPLFNHYSTLPESPLKRDILAMAAANGVPTHEVYTSNASVQTRLLNAHVSGFGHSARISLDDNVISYYPPSVRMVVGHEIGHYVMGHVIARLVVDCLIFTAGLLLVAWLGPLLVGRFGSWGLAAFSATGAIAVLWLLTTTYPVAVTPIQNAFIRNQEAQADIFGLNASRAPDGFAEFMIHDADTNRLSPNALDTLLFSNHPGVRSRVEMAMRWRSANAGAASVEGAGHDH